MNYSTKQYFIAKTAKSSYWCWEDALHCQRDAVTFICLCHRLLAQYVPLKTRGALHHQRATSPKPLQAPTLQHRTAREENPSGLMRSVWKHIGCVALGSFHPCFYVCPLLGHIRDCRLKLCPSNSL